MNSWHKIYKNHLKNISCKHFHISVDHVMDRTDWRYLNGEDVLNALRYIKRNYLCQLLFDSNLSIKDKKYWTYAFIVDSMTIIVGISDGFPVVRTVLSSLYKQKGNYVRNIVLEKIECSSKNSAHWIT